MDSANRFPTLKMPLKGSPVGVPDTNKANIAQVGCKILEEFEGSAYQLLVVLNNNTLACVTHDDHFIIFGLVCNHIGHTTKNPLKRQKSPSNHPKNAQNQRSII